MLSRLEFYNVDNSSDFDLKLTSSNDRRAKCVLKIVLNARVSHDSPWVKQESCGYMMSVWDSSV